MPRETPKGVRLFDLDTGYIMPNPPLSDYWTPSEPYSAEPGLASEPQPGLKAGDWTGVDAPRDRVKTSTWRVDYAPMPEGDEGFAPEPQPGVKDINPKDAVGIRKWRQITCVPFSVLFELGVAMLEGGRKYGVSNYRVAGVRASVYVDAAMGHIMQWWEGEDIDADGDLSHITKAIASLTVLRDAMIQDKLVDDRPPKADLELVKADLQRAVDGIFDRTPTPAGRYTEEGYPDATQG